MGVDLVEADDIAARGERAVEGQRLAPLREAADLGGVVKGLDVLAGSGDGHAVQQLEEVEVQGGQNCGGRALFCR